jgi:tetratricopeptide (TPR) repeat protein
MGNSREWLVRTRSGEILGPYNTLELAEGLRRRTFTVEDEIAPSRGHWVSAQGLSNRDIDEITRTSTRSEAASLHDRSADHEELTPTPDIGAPPVGSPLANQGAPVSPPKAAPAAHSSTSPAIPKPPRPFALVVLAIGVILGLWIFVLSLRPSKNAKNENNNSATSAMTDPGTKSPIVREAYELIHAGKNGEALKKLTEYHTRGPAKDDLDYLIPYAALLIQENESGSRAKKLLEGVLDSPAATPQLKARAHHWLGYLLLSNEEGDMGESHFLEALELNPKDPATRFDIGRSYLKQEKHQQALDYLQLAELEAPDLWIIHIYKGRARFALGHLEEARNSFRSAIDKAPERWMGYIYYGLFLSGAKENDEAQSVIRRMLTRDPSYEVNAPIPFGFYQERVDYGEYLEVYSRIMERSSSDLKEFGKLYINYLAHGPSGSEGKRLDVLAEKGSLAAKIVSLKVALDRELPNEDLHKVVQRAGSNLDNFGYYGYVLRGQVKTRLGDISGASADFEKALLLEPKAAISHWALANLLKKDHRDAEARDEIQRLLSYHPNYIPAIVALPNFN